MEVPALEALQDRFKAANTQVLGVSVDSVYVHANWGAGLGGISFPLLADFHPKGAMAESYGLYLADKGITDRATVIIDADGTVQHASSVGPGGQRDISELAKLCEGVNQAYKGTLPAPAKAKGTPASQTLFVKNSCGFSRAVLLARENLHLQGQVTVLNVTEDPKAMQMLKEQSGKEQSPCLMIDGQAMLESADIIKRWVADTAA